MTTDVVVVIDDIIQMVSSEINKMGIAKSEVTGYVTASTLNIDEPEDVSAAESEDEKNEDEFSKTFFTDVAPKIKQSNAAESGANSKYRYCIGCDCPHDRRIKRAKDPTDKCWYCYVCWRNFRMVMFEEAPVNDKWENCQRCLMGAWPAGGRFMKDGRFFCLLCWKGWVGALPQKSDWMAKLPSTAKDTDEKTEGKQEVATEDVKAEVQAEQKAVDQEAEEKSEVVGPTQPEKVKKEEPALPAPELVESEVPPVGV